MRGGDVFEGMVVGAIGGAVTSAISFGATSWLSGAGSGVTASETSYVAQAGTASQQTGTNIGAGIRTTAAGEATVGSTTAAGEFSWGAMFDSMFAGEGGAGLGSTLAQGALAIGGNILQGQDAAKEAEKAREFQAEQAEKNRESLPSFLLLL